MLKLTANTTSKGRACDRCRSAGSTVYCRSDSAFLCTTCDARIHAIGEHEHERVWVCEACEQNPSAYQCKADAASLCVSCDTDIHSANPLARRHHRVPVLPIPGPLYGPSTGGLLTLDCNDDKDGELCNEDELTESWLIIKNGGGGEDHALAVDEYLDLEEYGTNTTTTYEGDNGNKNGNNDSVVPFASDQAKDDKVRQCWFQLGLEFEGSSNAEYGSYPIASVNDSTVISLPSVDVGVVPEAVTSSQVSISHQRPSKGIIDLFTESAVDVPPIQLSPADREARVLRYREKKKTRRFDKTIRYASRKAYAETRPRIKGRFAKRTEVDADVDPMFSSDSIMSETGYGIVPSF